jgi:hypothetical protein
MSAFTSSRDSSPSLLKSIRRYCLHDMGYLASFIP